MHLSTETVADILKVRDAQARPRRGKLLILTDDGGEQLVRTVQVVAGAGARHEGGEDGAGLEVLLGEGLIERGCGE